MPHSPALLMTIDTSWNDPIWNQLYGHPVPEQTQPAPAPAPSQPVYLDILQQAAQQNVPLHSLTLDGIDEAARLLDA